MRPVERGGVPTDPAGTQKVYAEYADARADLMDRIGRYCCFCERPIKAGLAVEHVRHKDAHPELEREWTNLLLACVNCNSTKGTKPIGLFLFLPDRDNTFRCLSYSAGGRVRTEATLTAAAEAKATQLINLVGLDREPTNDPQAKDLRWNDRREAWDKATRYRAEFDAGRIGIEHVTDMCKADGHWSIWMTVFAGNLAVRLALISIVPGDRRMFRRRERPTPQGRWSNLNEALNESQGSATATLFGPLPVTIASGMIRPPFGSHDCRCGPGGW